MQFLEAEERGGMGGASPLHPSGFSLPSGTKARESGGNACAAMLAGAENHMKWFESNLLPSLPRPLHVYTHSHSRRRSVNGVDDTPFPPPPPPCEQSRGSWLKWMLQLGMEKGERKLLKHRMPLRTKTK